MGSGAKFVTLLLLLAGTPPALAQSPQQPVDPTANQTGYSSTIGSSALAPSGVRTSTPILSGGPPTAALAVDTFWQPMYSQPKGYKAGDWTFFPMVTGAAVFDDNVFATSANRRSDWVAIVRPELAWVKQGKDYGIEGHAYVEGREYARFSSEDQINGAASLGGTAMLGPNTQLVAKGQYVHSHLDRGLGEAVPASQLTTTDKPIGYDQFDAAAALNHRRDRWWTSVGVAATWIHFQNPTSGGIPLNLSYLNGNIVSVPVRVGYVVAPSTSVFVEGAGNSRDFDVNEYSSQGYRVVGGVLLEPGRGARVKGEAFAGYMNQDYNGATFQTVSTWTFGASMAFLLTDRLTASVAGRREAKETALTCLGVVFLGCGSSLIETWGAARLDYLLLPNLVIGGGATYLVDEVVNGNRTDRVWRPLASLKYYVNQAVTLGFDYRFVNFASSGFGVPGYDRNVYMFTINAKL